MQLGIIGLVIAVLLAGGVFVFTHAPESADKDVMQDDAVQKDENMAHEETGAEKDVMVKDETMQKDAMESDVMKKDDAMKGDSMQKDEGAMKDDATGGVMEKDVMMSHGGTYEAYSPEKIAWAQSGKVVLFFRASWCPTCRAVDADIRGHLSNIPNDLTILDVNYDAETALKQKYGVTYQHTFVQVDASGKQIAKWSSSPTLAALFAEVQ